MTTTATELLHILDELPENKAREVVDFARFLQQQAGDNEWERIISDPKPRPKLDQFVADAMSESPAEELDVSKL
jgi:hypothetical protein